MKGTCRDTEITRRERSARQTDWGSRGDGSDPDHHARVGSGKCDIDHSSRSP